MFMIRMNDLLVINITFHDWKNFEAALFFLLFYYLMQLIYLYVI